MKNVKLSSSDVPMIVEIMSGLLASGHYTLPGNHPAKHPDVIMAVTSLDKKVVKRRGCMTPLALVHAENLLRDIKLQIGEGA